MAVGRMLVVVSMALEAWRRWYETINMGIAACIAVDGDEKRTGK